MSLLMSRLDSPTNFLTPQMTTRGGTVGIMTAGTPTGDEMTPTGDEMTIGQGTKLTVTEGDTSVVDLRGIHWLDLNVQRN